MRSHRLLLGLEQLESREMLDASAFPSTSNTIGIISDQLNDGLSNSMVQFIATHMDGTQKLTASYNQEFRNYNPQWVLLYYKLATEAGPVSYIIDNQWSSDWSTVNANESWFMHNASGQRLTNSAWNWDQMDPTNTAWQQYWLNQVSTNIQESGAQGVFADSFDAGIGSAWYQQDDARFAGTNAANPASWPNGYTWIQQLQDLATTMQQGLNNVPGAPLYIPNVDALVTGWDNMNYAALPAAFAEGFGNWGPSYLSGSPSDWVMAMNRALSLTDQNKVVILQPYLQNGANSSLGMLQRGFDLGSYLLLKSDHTYINMVDTAGSPTSAYYYPEYTINLGSALAPPATNVSQYLWNNVYRRDFQNGIVLVNPSDTTYTIALPQTYALVNFQGGGALSSSSLDSAGNYIGGDLSTAPVTTVTLASGQTAILMNPALLPDAPTGLTATVASSSQNNLKWNAVPGATAYWVERSTDGTNWQVLATTTGNTTSYADMGLQTGTKYSYRVVAGNTIGNSSYSNVATAATGTTVTSVSSTAANGTYGIGSVISLTVGFSSAVNVSGTPQLALNSGGSATYSSGSGTNTLTFTYTVGIGQSANPLDEASTTALSLNGGTITDTNGNSVNLTLPASGTTGALGSNNAIVINTANPSYTYDAKGRLIGAYYPNGNVYARVYSSDGSSTATLTNGSGTVSSGVNSYAYTYNTQGQLTAYNSYYVNGNTFSRTYNSDGSSTATLKNSSGTLLDDYTYNAQSTLTAYDVYYANGNVFSRTYNSDGSSTATLTNSSGTVSSGVNSYAYTYNTQGQLTVYTSYYVNGNTFSRTYNNDGSSTATLKNSSGTLLDDYTYNAQNTLTAYDIYYVNGNIFSRTFNSDGSSTATLKNSSGTVSSGVNSYVYTYNTQGQLTAYNSYYVNGNTFSRTFNSDGSSTATLKNSSGQTIETYTYDAQGNLTGHNP